MGGATGGLEMLHSAWTQRGTTPDDSVSWKREAGSAHARMVRRHEVKTMWWQLPRRWFFAGTALFPLLMIAAGAPVAAAEADPQRTDDLLKQVGVERGLCVLLGEGLGETAVRLAQNSELMLYVQSSNAEDVRQTRMLLDEAQLLGTRVFVDKGNRSRLFLADNLADAVVLFGTADEAGGFSETELMRVLQPRGKLIAGSAVSIKPVPEGIGEWTHPYHGADNNPQSQDAFARAPYLTKFLATPWYGPMPQVTVSSGGRVFKAFGHLAFKRREWPMVGKLMATNGFNGQKLWERDLTPGFMLHRNTIVATPETLYLADNESCKLIDAATGKLVDEIVVPEGLADGPAWKWMTLQNGTLFALVGEQEKLHAPQRGKRDQAGWPWDTVREKYGPSQGSWGYGRMLLAMDLETRRILWSRREQDPIDSRATCMSAGRIFIYSDQKFLAAIDAASGDILWKQDNAELLTAIGPHERAQTARQGYLTSSYAKCNQDVLLLAGPQRAKLVAVAAEDGRLMWSHKDGNMQLVLREDALYAMGRNSTSKKLDYRSGYVLADLNCFRGNCTRATGTVDSIFARGHRHTGTLRLDVSDGTPRRIPAMRPACQDGVVVANGSLYWGPWMCDCNHSLVGVIGMVPAGDFDFTSQADNAERLEVTYDSSKAVDEFSLTAADWPTYRADNTCSASSPVSVPGTIEPRWQIEATPDVPLTAPVAAGGLVFFGGLDGIVHAVDAASGESRWKAYTGGPIRYPPTVSQARVFVGSGDGWVYAFEASCGRQLWRFRAAPVERKIPVYGRLSSTWPVASGVLVENGVAYAAAGIASHDGTHVYALDAETGEIKWQNNTSGNLLAGDEVVGVSVQGHLLINDGKLYLAGGNVVSPAIYDIETGECLNRLDQHPDESLDDHWKRQLSPRGSELFLVENNVRVGGSILYAPPNSLSRYNSSYILRVPASERVFRGTARLTMLIHDEGGQGGLTELVWKDARFAKTAGVALGSNAAVLAGQLRSKKRNGTPQPGLVALDLESGETLWSRPLPAPPGRWAVALDQEGRVIVTLTNGQVLCFAG